MKYSECAPGVMVFGNSSGALSGGGNSSVALRARMPKVASRSTRTKGGAARGSNSRPMWCDGAYIFDLH